ncbi:MAG: hypothetical protein WC747_03535 [Candidatus Babeliales bacterium]|jgi:hypothetical protein
MNKKLIWSALFIFGAYKNIMCSQDFKKGLELGAVGISLLASALEAHSNCSSNSSFHRALGKNYSERKIAEDIYAPISVATIQLATLACSRASNNNNCAVLNCVVSALNIVRISYTNFVKTSKQQDLLAQSIKNQNSASKTIEDYDKFIQQLESVIEDSLTRDRKGQELTPKTLQAVDEWRKAVQEASDNSSSVLSDNSGAAVSRITSSSQERLQS